MAAKIVKTIEQKYRFRRSDDEFPVRKIFETRYYATKYMKDFYPETDPMRVIIQSDPFTREGFVIYFLDFVE